MTDDILLVFGMNGIRREVEELRLFEVPAGQSEVSVPPPDGPATTERKK